ncbi:MAG: hypothetical protein AB7I41_13225 [Candidatus Sericytochromatia bacterium]
MTYTSSYQSQVPGSSVYSPFNRNGAGATPGAYPGADPSPAQPAMASDAFVPVASPEDMDRVVSSIDEKIARIRQAFSQPAPVAGMPPGQPAPAAAPVSQEEVQWALQLEQKVKSGQPPTAQETARYEDIARRLSAAQQPAAPTAPAAPAAAPVSQEDIQWALQLEQKVKSGQPPTAQETARYEDIAKRLSAAQQPAAPTAPAAPAAAPVSQEDIQWALQLEQKVKSGQPPTAQETARYEDIAKRLAAAQQPQQPAAPGATPPAGARDWNGWSKPFAPPGASPMPLPIAAPGSGQPVVTVPTSLRGAPQTPPAVAMTQYAPATLPPAAPAMPQQPQQPQAPVAPQAAAPQMGNVSQQEVQWALQLEQRVKEQRYQPNAQEVAAYENIAQRLSAAQAPAQQPAPQMAQQPPVPRPQLPPQQPMMPQQPQAPVAPQAAAPQMGNVSQQEVQWALQLEQRVKEQRYQPNAQEVAAYENIAQRLNAAQAPAQQPAPQMVQQRPGMPPSPQQVMMPPTPQQVPIVPQQYPHVQGQTPQYIVQPQPFVPQQPQQPQMAQVPPGYQQPGMPQQMPGMPPPGQKPGFTDRLKTAWNALWG